MFFRPNACQSGAFLISNSFPPILFHRFLKFRIVLQWRGRKTIHLLWIFLLFIFPSTWQVRESRMTAGCLVTRTQSKGWTFFNKRSGSPVRVLTHFVWSNNGGLIRCAFKWHWGHFEVRGFDRGRFFFQTPTITRYLWFLYRFSGIASVSCDLLNFFLIILMWNKRLKKKKSFYWSTIIGGTLKYA